MSASGKNGSCPICPALRDEIRHLRAQNTDLIEKLLAAASPAAASVLRPQTPTAGESPIVVGTDGQPYVSIDGKLVLYTEWKRCQDKLDEMVGGGRPAGVVSGDG